MSGLVQGDWLTDRDIQQSVEDELTWTPELDATTIGVSVNDGVITLAGEVRSLAEKIAATKATLRVHGVSVLVDEITVPDGISGPRHDTAIGKAVLHALSWADYVPRDSVDAEVRHGSVTLTGTVDWDYQREAARRAVASLAGVRDIDNQIELSDREYSADAVRGIELALARNAIVGPDIHVIAVGTEVTLTGSVRVWEERRQAERTAWASPHVTMVHDLIKVLRR